MHSRRFKGDFLGRLLLLLLVAFGLTVVLQARALRDDGTLGHCGDRVRGQLETFLLGSSDFAQYKVQTCPKYSRLRSSGSAI